MLCQFFVCEKPIPLYIESMIYPLDSGQQIISASLSLNKTNLRMLNFKLNKLNKLNLNSINYSSVTLHKSDFNS